MPKTRGDLSIYDRAMCALTVPAAVLLVINLVSMESHRPMGPFGTGEPRQVLLNNAINLLFAEVFQAILAVFLLVIAGLLADTFRVRKTLVSTPSLSASLAGIYVLSLGCAILVMPTMPEFAILGPMGLVVIALSWVALMAAIRQWRNARPTSPFDGAGSLA
ncbi:MAG: hypothetical protein ABJB03_11480 [Rhodoglobus sp.]